jgi:uncharacterized protein (DUF1697 family)
MNTFVALLRGINVGGKNRVKMETLKQIFGRLGLHNIRTYIQSGNVIFETENGDYRSICGMLASSKLSEELGFEVGVIVRGIGDLQNIMNMNPYLSKKNWENCVYMTFLSDHPSDQAVNIIARKNKADEIHFFENQVVLFCPDGYRNTVYSNTYFEKKLGVQATTRNWKTVNNIISLASSL